ncbi:MAG TPA: recombination-associated protein RdgC [Rudaea sp.]|nr:recombination-associated protein RdgC [Rudaea sp.]
MWFRNLTLFRFSKSAAKTLKGLEAKLDKHRLRPCGPIELATQGFISPHGRDEDVLLHEVGVFSLLTAAREDKLLPNSVVSDELGARLRKMTEKAGKPVGSRERKRLKDEVLTDLLPRAFTRLSKRNAYLDTESGWLVIDTASRKVAEAAVSLIREALGSFPAAPLVPDESPRVLMTDWLARGRLPAKLALGDECELRDSGDGGAALRCRRQDLESDEIREHLKSGKQAFQLGLVFDERLSFSLDEDLVVRKLRFLDQVQNELGDTEAESAVAELDARFALMSLELRRLFDNLQEWFGLPRPMDK